jgi:hypothetical protein
VDGWSRRLSRFAKLTRDAHSFLRSTVGFDQATGVILHRLATREERFLRLAEQAIYGHAQSPYLSLLREAGCEFGDLKALVAKEGLEGALQRLASDGVYVTFDEFKGRREAVRGVRRFNFTEERFDNPLVRPHFESRSGGTRGPGTRVRTAFSFMADTAANVAVALHVLGLSHCEHAVWYQGLAPVLQYAKVGRAPVAWFYPVEPFPLKMTILSRYLAVMSRLRRRHLPVPSFLGVGEPHGMARWLDRHLRRGRSICVTTYAGLTVRVAVAATEAGLSLDGACFIAIGEPFTSAKRRTVERSGARAVVRYAFTEAGIIGYSCANPEASDDIHFFRDAHGLIQRSRPVGESGLSVDAFLFTSLLPSAPKILLNVESGDYGLVTRRDCGCGFAALGLCDHISEIRSFEKLTGEGVTFVQSDFLRILEDVLPSRFGGTSADYQVLEEEQENGILRLLLIVSPGVGSVDEEQIHRTFLDELARRSSLARFGARIWERAGTVQIVRREPVATKAGKILPFHVRQAQQAASNARTVR